MLRVFKGLIILGALFERIYPYILGGVFTIALLLFGFKPNVQGFEKVVDGLITFSSIVVGFLSALLAVILSLSNTEVVKYIFSYTRKGRFTKKKRIVFFSYCKQAIYFGFVCIFMSISMYLLKDKKVFNTFQEIAFISWLYIAFTFIGCSVRIIDLLILILTKVSGDLTKNKTSSETKKDSSQNSRNQS
jgi:hypothetical protein